MLITHYLGNEACHTSGMKTETERERKYRLLYEKELRRNTVLEAVNKCMMEQLIEEKKFAEIYKELCDGLLTGSVDKYLKALSTVEVDGNLEHVDKPANKSAESV